MDKSEQALKHIHEPTELHLVISDRKHPHFGRTGRLTGEVVVLTGTNTRMAKFLFDEPDEYGVDGCFVSRGQCKEDNDGLLT